LVRIYIIENALECNPIAVRCAQLQLGSVGCMCVKHLYKRSALSLVEPEVCIAVSSTIFALTLIPPPLLQNPNQMHSWEIKRSDSPQQK
jgi:hypothetical protein